MKVIAVSILYEQTLPVHV